MWRTGHFHALNRYKTPLKVEKNSFRFYGSTAQVNIYRRDFFQNFNYAARYVATAFSV